MSELEDTIRQIHDAPQQGVLVVSGAGSQATAWLLGVAGASRTLLEVVIPYGRKSMIDFLGFEPEQFVSEETAKSMARAAYRRGMGLRDNDLPVVGVACTATIATDRTKRGEHRAYLATWDDAGWGTFSLRLDKGRRDRAGEEAVVSSLLVQALARTCGVESELALGLTEADVIDVRQEDHLDPLTRLLSGEVGTVTVHTDGRMSADEPVTAPLLPGSFNPLHHGHEGPGPRCRRSAGITGSVRDISNQRGQTSPNLGGSNPSAGPVPGKISRGVDSSRDLPKKGGTLSRMHVRNRLGHGGTPGCPQVLPRQCGLHAYGPGRDLGGGLPLSGGRPGRGG